MRPSRREALAAAGGVGLLAGGAAALVPAVGRLLAGTVAVFCALATGLATWSVPRVRFESSADVPGLSAAALLSGAFGGFVVLAFMPPLFVVGLALGVRLALGVVTLAAGVAGAGAFAAAVVLAERREGERLVVADE